MTQPTIERLLNEIAVSPTHYYPHNKKEYYEIGVDTVEAIRAVLTAQSANTLPLDEVPEGWYVAMLCQDVVHFHRLWQCRLQHEDGRTRFSESQTPAEALRAAIAKVTP